MTCNKRRSSEHLENLKEEDSSGDKSKDMKIILKRGVKEYG
jgi:hypothetical protein